MLNMEVIENRCFRYATELAKTDLFMDMDVFEITEFLIKSEIEKHDKEMISDKFIPYNDEIVSIEEVGEQETIDISVSGDNLFFCSNILTKNSFGTAATMDFIFALMRTEELDAMGQIMVKQLKSRFGDVNYYKRFVIGVDIHKFKLYDVDNATADLNDTGKTDDDDAPVFDKSKFGQQMLKRGDRPELNFD